MRDLNQNIFGAPRLPAALALLALFAAGASAKDLDPDLRQQVIFTCSSDAYRLCPQALGNEKDAVACMRTKRSALNGACRVVYDKAVRTLASK